MRRALVLLLVFVATSTPAAADGITSRADDLRTGWYGAQPALSPGQVSSGAFGRLFKVQVDGQVYAQPLVADGTLLVATEENQVYGLDPVTGDRRWTRDLGAPFNADDVGCADLWPHVGVTATPVIDGDTAYLTSKTYEDGRATYLMHALDVRTGAEKTGFPVPIAGAADNAPGKSFQALTELQRPALLLMGGVVYAAFGGHCDFGDYQGWVAGVSTSGVLKTLWTAETAPGASGAGIWQAGGGLMSDGPGRIFLATGNFNSPPFGPGDQPPGALGESVVRVGVGAGGHLSSQDFFSPYDADSLDQWDADFGSGGPVALPSKTELAGSPFGTTTYPRLLVAVGKVGYVYLLDRDALGGRGQADGGDAVVARIGPDGGVWSSPAVWPGDGGWVLIPTASPGNDSGGSFGRLNFYRAGLDGSGRPTLALTASTSDAFGFGSSAPVVTSDGLQSGSALAWLTWSPGASGGDAQLRAYLPAPAPGSDPAPFWSAPVGQATKFTPPGVGDGRVYVANYDGEVYGFGSPVDPALTGPDVACGTATVGSQRICEARFTAHTDVEVTSIASSDANVFAPEAPALPQTLHDGDQLTVQVGFSPQAGGPVGGSLYAHTSLGTFQLGLSGTGLADGPLLVAGTPAVSFGGVRVGHDISKSVTFHNAGSEPLTIDGVQAPAPPFSLGGEPATGHVVDPGDSLSVTVDFDAVTPGDYSGSFTVLSTGGDVAVHLSAAARTGPALAIAGSGAFGDVTLGDSSDRTVTLTNTGGTTLTVTKSKPPVGGPFRALTSVPEGSAIGPGASVSLTVRFTPTAIGAAQGDWAITGDDGSGEHAIAFAGAGVASALPPTPITPFATPTSTPTPTPTQRPRVRPRLSSLHAKPKHRRVVISFRLNRAAKVKLVLRHGRHVLKRVRIAGRRGINRRTVTARPGRYVVRASAAGGNTGSRAVRVPKLP